MSSKAVLPSTYRERLFTFHDTVNIRAKASSWAPSARRGLHAAHPNLAPCTALEADSLCRERTSIPCTSPSPGIMGGMDKATRSIAVKRSRKMAMALAAVGTLHFVSPAPFDRIVPRTLPGSPRAYTYASGIAELGIAALLTNRKTCRFGGLAAAALFVAVYPANIQMALDARGKRPRDRVIAYGRLPFQFPMIRSAWRIWRARQA